MKRLITWEKIESWLIVSSITVLVWLYAEGQTLEPHETSVTLKFVGEGGQTLKISPVEATLGVDYQASRGTAILFNQLASETVFEIPVRPGLAPDNYVRLVDVADALQGTDLSQLSVKFEGYEPEQVQVVAEPLVQVELPVVIISPTGAEFSVAPEAEPRRVSVTLPASLAEQANELSLTATIESVEGADPDVPQTLADLPLTLPNAIVTTWTELEQPTVNARFTLRSQLEMYELQPVSVWVVAPPSVSQQYDIQVTDEAGTTISGITVQGPADQIARLRAGTFLPVAELEITNEALIGVLGPTSWLVESIRLPEGVTVLEPTLPYPLEITVTPRQINGDLGDMP